MQCSLSKGKMCVCAQVEERLDGKVTLWEIPLWRQAGVGVAATPTFRSKEEWLPCKRENLDVTSLLFNNVDIFIFHSSGIVTARQKGPGKHTVRLFFPKITFAVKDHDGSGSNNEAGAARAWGEGRETTGQEINFDAPSLRGSAAKLGKEEHSSWLHRVWSLGPAPSIGNLINMKDLKHNSRPNSVCILTRFLFKFQRHCSFHSRNPIFPSSLHPQPHLQHDPPSPLMLFFAILTSLILIFHPIMEIRFWTSPSELPTSISRFTVFKLEELGEHQPSPLAIK